MTDEARRAHAEHDLWYREQTRDHIQGVQKNLETMAAILRKRGEKHDASKLQEPEYSGFKDMALEFKQTPHKFGSPEAKAIVAKYRDTTVVPHYQKNDHHPEHYPNGMSDMSLFALLEMLADWRKAGERDGGIHILEALIQGKDRWNISDELYAILLATIEELGWIEGEVQIVEDQHETPRGDESG